MKFTSIYLQERGEMAVKLARVHFRQAKAAIAEAAATLEAQGETIVHETALEVVTAKGSRLYVAS